MKVKTCSVKQCAKCGIVRDLNAFGRHRGTADGLQYWCKRCQREANVAYRCGPVGRERQSVAQEKYRRSVRGREANRRSQRKYGKTVRGRFQRLRSHAQKRGLVVTVTANSFARWWNSEPDVCAYCGATVEEYRKVIALLKEYAGSKRTLRQFRDAVFRNPQALCYEMTVDRVDGERGYENGNLVKACWLCNKVKGHVVSGEEMKLIGRRLRTDLIAGLGEKR